MNGARALVGGLLLTALGASMAQEGPEKRQPLESGIEERAGRRLIQLRISVEPKKEEDERLAAELSKDDFIVRLGFDLLPADQYEIDRLCEAPADSPVDSVESERDAPFSGASIVLYLDYLRLGVEARENTREMVRRLIPELVGDGNRVRVVANRGRLQTLADWSTDPDELALAVQAGGGANGAPGAARPPSPEERIDSALLAGRVAEARAIASERNLSFQQELSGGGDAFLRLIDELGKVPIPKVVIYFADLPYSRRADVVEYAVLSGVNIYAVKADGLTAVPFPSAAGPGGGPGIVPMAFDPGSIVRMSQTSLARRTGGRVFYGASGKGAPRKLLRSLRSDLRCVYVLSIKTEDLTEDLSLPMHVRLRTGLRKRIRIRTTPRITVPSEARLREQEAERAFSAATLGVHPALLTVRPVEVLGSKIRALVQLALDPDIDLPGATTTWDMGISIAGRGAVTVDRNVRVISRNAPRIVFETLTDLRLGQYSLVGVAQEVEGNGLARGIAVGSYDEPRKREFGFAGPLEVRQGRYGAFVSTDRLPDAVNARLGRSDPDEKPTFRRSGWLAALGEMVFTDRPTLFVGLLCRGRRHRTDIRISKTIGLEGGDEFSGTVRLWTAGGPDRCTIEESWIEAGTFPWEGRPYRATFTLEAAEIEGGEPAVLRKTFWVVGPFSVERVSSSADAAS